MEDGEEGGAEGGAGAGGCDLVIASAAIKPREGSAAPVFRASLAWVDDNV